MPTWYLQDNVMARYYLPFRKTEDGPAESFFCGRVTIFSDKTLDFDIGNFRIPIRQVVGGDDIADMSDVFIHNELMYNVIVRAFTWRP